MTAPKVVVLDVSYEAHEEIVECVDDIEYAKRYYGNNSNFALYTLLTTEEQ